MADELTKKIGPYCRVDCMPVQVFTSLSSISEDSLVYSLIRAEGNSLYKELAGHLQRCSTIALLEINVVMCFSIFQMWTSIHYESLYWLLSPHRKFCIKFRS